MWLEWSHFQLVYTMTKLVDVFFNDPNIKVWYKTMLNVFWLPFFDMCILTVIDVIIKTNDKDTHFRSIYGLFSKNLILEINVISVILPRQ